MLFPLMSVIRLKIDFWEDKVKAGYRCKPAFDRKIFENFNVNWNSFALWSTFHL